MLGLLVLFLVKLGLMILPLTVLCLAGRRLLLSRSANAWLYAAASCFAWVTVLGLTPWALGFGSSHPVFFVFAAMIPAVWYSVVTLCNSPRHLAYDSEMERTFLRLTAIMRQNIKPAPLILEGADWPDAPTPVFRHSDAAPERPMPAEAEVATQAPPPVSEAAPAQPAPDDAPVSRLLEITRTMRRNRTSDDRRIKLLPPPASQRHTSLAFLNSPGPA